MKFYLLHDKEFKCEKNASLSDKISTIYARFFESIGSLRIFVVENKIKTS